MTTKTKVERILELIEQRPGIRSVEIEDELDIEYVSAQMKPYVTKGYLLAEKVQTPNGREIMAYRRNAQYEKLDKFRTAKAAPSATLVAALYTNGDFVIEKGGKALRLTPAETRELVNYLDRINVDQLLAEAS